MNSKINMRNIKPILKLEKNISIILLDMRGECNFSFILFTNFSSLWIFFLL